MLVKNKMKNLNLIFLYDEEIVLNFLKSRTAQKSLKKITEFCLMVLKGMFIRRNANKFLGCFFDKCLMF